MIRLAAYLLILYLLTRLIKGLFGQPKGNGKSKGIEGEEMVMDPNCNTYIPQRDAVKGKVGGEKLYFCSEQCLKEYKTGK